MSHDQRVHSQGWMKTEETCNGEEKMHSKRNTATAVLYHFLPPHLSLSPDTHRGLHNSNVFS